jgi:voltage-gated potassium channel
VPHDGDVRKHTNQVWLLAGLVAIEAVNPLLRGEGSAARIFSVVLFTAVVIIVFRALLRTKLQRYVGVTLAAVAIVGELLREQMSTAFQLPLDVLTSTVLIAFFAFIFTVLVTHLFLSRHLEFGDVIGAFSGYFIIALLWGRLYALVWQFMPRAFRISPDITWQLRDWHMLHTLFDYFSLTTLATVGYGEVTTTAPIANTLVWLEVMCGQFYLAVIIASIVGIKVTQVLAASRDRTGS